MCKSECECVWGARHQRSRLPSHLYGSSTFRRTRNSAHLFRSISICTHTHMASYLYTHTHRHLYVHTRIATYICTHKLLWFRGESVSVGVCERVGVWEREQERKKERKCAHERASEREMCACDGCIKGHFDANVHQTTLWCQRASNDTLMHLRKVHEMTL